MGLARELGVKAVEKITKRGYTAVGGARGLGVMTAPAGTQSWVLRVAVNGKRRHIGLGPLSEVTLAQARQRALAMRNEIRDGIDPLAARRAARAQAVLDATAATFKDVSEQCIASKEAGWSNDKHAAQWRSTLATYAYPVVSQLPVKEVTMQHVLAILKPLWTTKTETASRLRQRIEVVLGYATAHGLRQGDNPARWKGNLDAILPAAKKVQTVTHHAALPFVQAPAFWQQLQAMDGNGARALQAVLLTACRSGEIRGLRWSEVDLEAQTLTIPAERMKLRKAHTVPVAEPLLTLLKAQAREGDYVFPGIGGKRPMSDMTLSAVMKRLGLPYVPHGLRSTFRDFASEKTQHPGYVAEMALAHAVQGVEGAYRRGELLEKRRLLMAEWAQYVAGASVE